MTRLLDAGDHAEPFELAVQVNGGLPVLLRILSTLGRSQLDAMQLHFEAGGVLRLSAATRTQSPTTLLRRVSRIIGGVVLDEPRPARGRLRMIGLRCVTTLDECGTRIDVSLRVLVEGQVFAAADDGPSEFEAVERAFARVAAAAGWSPVVTVSVVPARFGDRATVLVIADVQGVRRHAIGEGADLVSASADAYVGLYEPVAVRFPRR